MKRNPFHSSSPRSTSADTIAGARSRNFGAFAPANNSEADDHAERGFLFCVALTTTAFVIAMLFVFQEARHTRDLYHMSLFVSHVEAEKVEWRQKHRFGAARNAELLAVLHADHSLKPGPSSVDTSRVFAMR